MASRPKRKELNGNGTITGSASSWTGSYSPPGGVFGFSDLEDSTWDSRKKKRKDKMSRENFTLTPYHDGHLWRKYGQKWIKGRPFPRLYFKCSYYEDKKCMATKLVEQHNDNIPPLFKVTYMYEHTCNAAPVPALDIVEADLTAASSDGLRMLRFDSHGNSCWMQEEQQHHQPMSWSPFQMMNFDSSNRQLQQQHQTSRPRASSFLITETLPESLSTNNKDYILTTWNSFRCAIEEHLFNDHADAPGSMASWATSMDVHNLDSWACEDVIF